MIYMDGTVKEYLHPNGRKIVIFYDDAFNPRAEQDTASTLVSWMDEVPGDRNIEYPKVPVKKLLRGFGTIARVRPVFYHWHHELTIRTEAFRPDGDPQGQCGLAYITPDKAVEMGLDPEDKADLAQRITWEVEMFDFYLRGDIYGYVIWEPGELVDMGPNELPFQQWEVVEGCGGHYGWDDVIQAAEFAVKD